MANVNAQRRAAVLGRPVGHSLSPVLHSAAYASLGLDWTYTAVDCGEAELPGLLAGLGPEWAGLSLTMPLKRAALVAADTADPLAVAVGAANTLILDDPAGPAQPSGPGTGGPGTGGPGTGGPGTGGSGRRLTAYNTDVAGIVEALREAGVDAPTSAVVLGAGGTAQAALAALRELGVTAPVVLVRDPSRTADLRATADRLGIEPVVRAGLPGPIPAADLVVSTLPAGAADRLRPPGTVLLDAVYHPWPTPLAASATAAGARVVSGLAMLLHQAAAQVTLMTGAPAPLAAMRAALRARTEKPAAPAPL